MTSATRKSTLNCLAFDLGRSSGWAAGDLRGKLPVFGSFRIVGTSWGEQAISLADHVSELMWRFKPAVVAYEQPIVIHAGAAQVLAGYAFIVEYLAGTYGAACTAIDNNKAKHVFAGFKYSKKIVPYPGIVRAHELGFPVDTTDQADALAVWHCAQQWFKHGRISVE